MPAPDIPPISAHDTPERVVHTHLHVRLAASEALAGGVVIVIDALRASVTIGSALAAGAACVVPVLTVEEARRRGDELRGGRNADLPGNGGVLLGGERGGDLIPGFDLDNSPRSYTPERVAGRAIVFTTTNGTAALLHASGAASVVVGSLANLSAVADAVAEDHRPVHVLCAGSREYVGLDDVLVGGAFVEALLARGRRLPPDDSGRIALRVWRATGGDHVEILRAMRESRGRGDVPTELARDFDVCSRVDWLSVVPRYDAARGVIVADSHAATRPWPGRPCRGG